MANLAELNVCAAGHGATQSNPELFLGPPCSAIAASRISRTTELPHVNFLKTRHFFASHFQDQRKGAQFVGAAHRRPNSCHRTA